MSAERRILWLVIGGLLIIGLAAFTAWLLTAFEPRTKQVHLGYSAEARRNDLLAAERLLTKLAMPVESVAGRGRLWNPPPPTDTLVVLGLDALSEARRARLMGWVEQGGHLIVEPSQTWSEEAPSDDWLSALGFKLVFVGSSLVCENDAVEGRRFELPGVPHAVAVAFPPGYALEGQAGDEELAMVAGRPQILRRRIGKGMLTVLSDIDFMRNRAIGEHDHAYVTAWLLAPEEGGKVWLLFESDVPWLGAVLWSLAPQALISAAVLVLAWLWLLGGRLGPLVDVPERRRRDLIEHLDASGRFLWMHGRASHLVDTTRARILGHWLRRHPWVAPGDTLAQAELLAGGAGGSLEARSVERIHRALVAQADDEATFVEQAMLLRQIRRGLQGRGAGARWRSDHGI